MNDPVAERCRSLRQQSLQQRFPERAKVWQLRTRSLAFSTRPLVMGIVNVTPDSFSDGGNFFEPQSAIDHGLQLVADGADLLDIGGESTRPYSDPVAVDEELRRVLPVVEALTSKTPVPISVDTSKASVAEAAVKAGAEIINDVSGLEGDPQMLRVAKETEAGLCVMHMRGSPQTMQDDPRYDDVVAEILEYLKQRKHALTESGINADRICLDVGIGFGKTHTHNLQLLGAAGEFHALGQPLLIGHSRKGFLAKILGDKEADRTPATVGVALALATNGIQILRVHDVAATREALLAFEAVGGIDGTILEINE